MADDIVKWIKIKTNMFDDEKMDFITSLPEADAIIVIWVRLLSLAGKCNAGGYIYLTEKIPYTDDMLSHKFRKPINIIKLALNTLNKLGMIEYDEGIIFLTNWVKHQNIEGLEKIKERDKERKRKERSNKKQLLIEGEMSQDSHGTVHGHPDTDTDLDRDKDKDTYIEDFFKSVWSLYPNKKGVAAVSKKNKVELYGLGLEKVTNCINAYKKDVEAQRKNGFKDLKYQYGSTFFNGGYEDFINTEADKPTRPPLTIVVEDRD